MSRVDSRRRRASRRSCCDRTRSRVGGIVRTAGKCGKLWASLGVKATGNVLRDVASSTSRGSTRPFSAVHALSTRLFRRMNMKLARRFAVSWSPWRAMAVLRSRRIVRGPAAGGGGFRGGSAADRVGRADFLAAAELWGSFSNKKCSRDRTNVRTSRPSCERWARRSAIKSATRCRACSKACAI